MLCEFNITEYKKSSVRYAFLFSEKNGFWRKIEIKKDCLIFFYPILLCFFTILPNHKKSASK